MPSPTSQHAASFELLHRRLQRVTINFAGSIALGFRAGSMAGSEHEGALVPFASNVVDQSSWWAGLSKEWDESPLLRQRMRDKDNLLMPHPKVRSSKEGQQDWVERSIHNIRFNKDVLMPALRRWSQHGPDTVPSIDLLFAEIQDFFELHNRTDKGMGECHFNCWNLRKLMTLLKAQTSKNNPPRDSWTQSGFPFIILPLEISISKCKDPSSFHPRTLA